MDSISGQRGHGRLARATRLLGAETATAGEGSEVGGGGGGGAGRESGGGETEAGENKDMPLDAAAAGENGEEETAAEAVAGSGRNGLGSKPGTNMEREKWTKMNLLRKLISKGHE